MKRHLPKGVTEHYDHAGKLWFRARRTVGGEKFELGLYATQEEASSRYQASKELTKEAPKGSTLIGWGQKWLDRRETDGHHRAVSKERSCWRTHVAIAHFASWPLRRIQRVDIVRWLRELSQSKAQHAKTTRKTGKAVVEVRELDRRIGRQTVKNALALLRRALTDAADEGLVTTNVALGVGVPKSARVDEGWTYLTALEIDAILALALRDDQRAIFTVAIYTGLRGGELWGLRWSDVVLDGDRPELVVRHSYRGPTKSGKVRRVPLLRQAKEALEAWRRVKPGIGAALVFPAERVNKKKKPEAGFSGCHAEGFEAGWSRVRGLAGIERRVRFHDLRHTTASHLITGSWGRAWSLEEVQGVLGHGSRTTTERYAHLAPERLHGARAETDAATASKGR